MKQLIAHMQFSITIYIVIRYIQLVDDERSSFWTVMIDGRADTILYSDFQYTVFELSIYV